MGRGNLLPFDQDYIVSNTTLADGIETRFVADDIDLAQLDSTALDEAIEVYLGGASQYGTYTVDGDSPVQINFTTAPTDGVEVTILVRQAGTWYAPGAGTPSNGIALQDTDTLAARFLRGGN